MRLLIKNCRLYNDSHTIRDVYIQQGVIVEIGENLSFDLVDTVDAKGRFLLPGLIDMHCNICDPGYETKEDCMSVSRAAVHGGYTSITALPNTSPVIDNKTVISYILNNNSKLFHANIFPYGSMTKGLLGEEIAEIGEMKQAGIVALSDGGKCIKDAGLLGNIMLYTNMFDLPLITTCDDRSISADGVMNKGKYATAIGLRGIPREAEETIIARDLILAMHNNARLHISLISTKGAVDLIRLAKARNINVTCDTCPHYFTLTEEAVDSYNTFAKVRPPLRTQEDVQAIIEGLVDGTIDVISTGHSPDTIQRKQVEFDNASFGISALETAFGLSYDALVKTNILTLEQLVEKMSSTPAEILRLHLKGEIKVGSDADLIIVDVDNEYKVDASQFSSKAKYSPVDGKSLYGKVVCTILSGNLAYLDINE